MCINHRFLLSDRLWILLPLGSAGELGQAGGLLVRLVVVDCFLGFSVSCFVAWHSLVCQDPSELHFPPSISEPFECLYRLHQDILSRGHLGFRIAWMAAWLSVNMVYLLGVMYVVCMSSSICSARTSPVISAAYPVNVADVPMY